MAKKRTDKESSPTKDLLKRIRERYKVMVEADRDNRKLALEDMRFVNEPGAQWDAVMKKERGERPCYEFNKLRVTVKRIVNDMRSSRPAGKVRGVEDGDTKTAEIYEGLIRNIWNVCDGDTVVDGAAEYQVSAGMGAWRVVTKYSGEDAFEQDIALEAINNPFCLYADPAAKDAMKRDARDFLLTDRISKTSYEQRWPNAKKVDWEAGEFDDDDEEWQDDETVRIVEYWWKEPVQTEVWQLQDGKVIDAASDEAKLIPPESVLKRRQVTKNQVRMCIASGEAVLEGPTDWAGKFLPFVMVFGEHMVIDGKSLWWGLPRFAKDAQRAYNISRTSIAEAIALAPQAKTIATVDQLTGHTKAWAEAHQKNYPYLLYNADPKAPGPPIRLPGAEVPAAAIAESQIASDDLKAVTGIFDPSLGNQSNESSGRAILARQQQGEIATFNYMDNLAKGIRYTWEILTDLIPKIFDTQRALRVLGSDGAEDYVTINQFVTDPATGEQVKLNDLTQGKYDVTVTVGPSWTTKRQEAAEIYLQLMQANPAIFGVAGDLIFKSMDLPYADDIAERLQTMLPPPIQQMLSKGKDAGPEATAAMAQAEQAMQQVQMIAQQMEADAAALQGEKAEVEKAKADLQVQAANLKAEYHRIVADLTKREADIAIKVAQAQSEQERAQVQAEGEKARSEANSAVQEVTKKADELIAQMYSLLTNPPTE